MLGARSRLLPPSSPFRFFGAAVVLHALAWLVVAVGAEAVPGFMGGAGWVAGGLHFITLGVLAATAMGASYQLLPVATRAPMASVRACRASFWLLVPGVMFLAHGLARFEPWALHLGATAAIAALAVYLVLIADNLRRVDDMPGVTRHAWVALAALLGLLVLGGLLAADLTAAFLPDRLGTAAAHAILAGYGFMGMLVLGFSHVLMPMFVLSQWPKTRLDNVSAALGAAGLAVAAVGALAGLGWLLLLGGALGLGAAAAHLRVMALVMKSRMKRNLGDSFILVRIAWAMLPASIVVGMAAAAGIAPAVTVPLWGFLLIFGWLLTFLMGVLQRIIPFLASMHSVQPGVTPVLVSNLTADKLLRVHLVAHLAALALVAAGIVTGIGVLVLVGALAGLVGAVAFAVFAVEVWRRLNRHLNQNQNQNQKDNDVSNREHGSTPA